jgi:hypothetical protein
MSVGLGVSFQSTTYNVALQNISYGQVQTAQSLLQHLDGFQDMAMGGFQPSLAQMMLQPPMGYLPGAIGQSIAQAQGFLQGLQTGLMGGNMAALSIGNRMLMGLGMFASPLFTGNASFNITNMSVNVVGTGPNAPQGRDKFAVTEGCRSGVENPSNLQNSPHVQLALHNILKDNPDGMAADTLKKKLEEDYGIKSELTTVKNKDGTEFKALKFENGDVLADGTGNGAFGNMDYNLKGAVADIKEKYGITPEDFEKSMKAQKEAGAFQAGGTQAQTLGGGFGPQAFNQQFMQIQSMFASAMPFGNMQPFFPMQDISMMFTQALMFARY